MDPLGPDGGTELLVVWKDGGDEASEPLIRRLSSKLNRLTHLQLRRKRPDHTLQLTPMAHEMLLRLFGLESRVAKLWLRRALERTAQP